MPDNYLDIMFKIALEGGAMSRKIMADSRPTLKPDNSVLTKADMAVSQMVRRKLKHLLKSPDHILIDEEDKNSRNYFDQKRLENTPYIWVIDPIDGTRSFSNRMPFYGVSFGLLKDLKPWLGVVYFPVLDELFFSDGKKSFYAGGASSLRPKKNLIKKIDQKVTPQSVFFGNDSFFKSYNWDFTLCQMMMPSCAVLDLCYPAIGRGAGALCNSYIWDFAGSWPIFESAGLKLHNLNSARTIDRLETSLFQGNGDKTWRLTDYYLLSSPRNFPVLRGAISKRT